MRRLIAWLFGLGLVYYGFGYKNYLRIVHKTLNGDLYIVIYGEHRYIDIDVNLTYYNSYHWVRYPRS